MAKNLSGEQGDFSQDVAAIITSMTDNEKSFLQAAVEAVVLDPGIGQVILCVEEKNEWLDSVIGPLLKDPRLEVVRIPKMHPGAVRNRALAHVQKPWIAFCDGDDVWCKGKTIIQRTYASRTGADLVGAGHYLMDEGGRIRAFGLSLFLPMPSSWLVRTEIMRQYSFNEVLSQGSDGAWWISTANNIQKVKCPKVLVRYRVRADSVSSTTTSKKRKSKVITFAKIPILGFGILFFTYCLWIVTRHQHYRWRRKWSAWLRRYEEKKRQMKNA